MIKERFDLIINELGLSGRQFEKACGLPTGSYSSISDGIGANKLKQILFNFPRISLDWLIMGEGEMFKQQAVEPQPQNTAVSVTKIYPAQEYIAEQSVPYYDMPKKESIAMLFDGKMRRRDFLYIPDLPPCDGAVMMEGQQMSPELKHGDVILYKKVKDLKKGLFWGHIYLLAFELDGEEHIMVKYIQPSEDQGSVKLVSENREFGDRDVPLDAIKGAAVVRASLRYRPI